MRCSVRMLSIVLVFVIDDNHANVNLHDPEPVSQLMVRPLLLLIRTMVSQLEPGLAMEASTIGYLLGRVEPMKWRGGCFQKLFMRWHSMERQE
ncbi:hypothetical protein SKAU_G00288710 [Synaphobranchus kaupii]|uniref:Secreted protein n=1 Tax=Synaphobranchus kaupii TaxID=118154 RepID=A0A9Q1ETE5_SYNKA|nr:hypothetical protein SKAU_G00288710 [Synaphobranchus kaupii]